MDLQTILAFTLVAVVVELSPGPNFFLLVRTVPCLGLAPGFANIGGFAAAFATHGALSVLGLTALIAAFPLALEGIKLVGGAYLMLLGVRALRDARGSMRISGARPTDVVDIDVGRMARSSDLIRAGGTGFLTNMLNPKIALFYLAAFPAFVGPAEPAEASVLVAIHIIVAVAWFSTVALLCARLTRAASTDTLSRAMTMLSGVVLLGLGFGVVTS